MAEDDALIATRYRLLSRVGHGAMGVVWHAEDERLRRPVALKQVVLPAAADEQALDQARRRVMREGRMIARLHHPHAITVYDVVEHDGTPWLVMEYLPSRSLAEVLGEDGPQHPVVAARLGRQVADALAAAHDAGIVHRDVKPGNVLIGDKGIVKVTDFGIARAVDDVTITSTGRMAGTPAYLAPEVARGADADFRSDVYSLGSTLYAATEGGPPFGTGDNALAVLHRVATGEHPPPRHAGPLTALLTSLLEHDPERRPAMHQVCADLARLVAAEDGTEEWPSTPFLPRPEVETAPSSSAPAGGSSPGGGPSSVPAGGAPVGAAPEGSGPSDGRSDAAAPAAARVPGDHAPAGQAPPARGPSPEASAAQGPALQAREPQARDPQAPASQAPGTRAPAGRPAPTPSAPEHAGTPPRAWPTPAGQAEPRPAGSLATPPPPTGGGAPAAPPAPAAAAVRSMPGGAAGHVDEPDRASTTRPATTAPVAAPGHDAEPGDDGPPGEGAPGRGRRWPWVVAVAAVVALVAVVAVAALLGTTGGGGASVSGGSPSSTPQAGDVGDAGDAGTATPGVDDSGGAAGSDGAGSSAVPISGSPDDQARQQAVIDYYGLLPNRLDEGWQRLTPHFQASTAGGYDNYRGYWGSMQEVTVRGVSPAGGQSVDATVTYRYANGRTVDERTVFGLIYQDGIWKIDSQRQAG